MKRHLTGKESAPAAIQTKLPSSGLLKRSGLYAQASIESKGRAWVCDAGGQGSATLGTVTRAQNFRRVGIIA